MALVDSVRAVLERLAPHGWGELFARHGLDLEAADLRGELLRQLPGVDRDLPGFEDFAAERKRVIKPGRRARSLLYHALASPGVVAGADGSLLGVFPTAAELCLAEDLVFGIAPPSLEQIAARFPGAPLAIAVFATEYRPGHETVHSRHADLCLARTGSRGLARRRHGTTRGAAASCPSSTTTRTPFGCCPPATPPTSPSGYPARKSASGR